MKAPCGSGGHPEDHNQPRRAEPDDRLYRGRARQARELLHGIGDLLGNYHAHPLPRRSRIFDRAFAERALRYGPWSAPVIASRSGSGDMPALTAGLAVLAAWHRVRLVVAGAGRAPDGRVGAVASSVVTRDGARAGTAGRRWD
jgi:hypothetical protein